jgi:hypothetical protein
VTGEQVAALIAAGRFWWMRGDQFFATDIREPESDDDVYLLDASPEWVAAWGGDPQAIADSLTPRLVQAVTDGLTPMRPHLEEEL